MKMKNFAAFISAINKKKLKVTSVTSGEDFLKEVKITDGCLIGFDDKGTQVVFFDAKKREVHRSDVYLATVVPNPKGIAIVQFVYNASKFFSNFVSLQFAIEEDCSGKHLFNFDFEAAPVFPTFSNKINVRSGGGAGAGGGQCCQNN